MQRKGKITIINSERTKELRRNTLIIGISNICSKAIVFILSPLYSFYMTTNQYGTMDLVVTTIRLLVPVFCFDIFEATFRFASDKEYDSKKVLSSSLMIAFIGIIAVQGILLFLLLLGANNLLINYISIMAALEVIISILRQFTRGCMQMKVFAASSIVEAAVLLISNICFLVYYQLGFNGWAVSYLLSAVASIVYLFFAAKVSKNFSLHAIDRRYIGMFIKFCVPLLPTATMWWIMNASDRYMIALFIGNAATGIYAVANKIPAILSVVENVFYQSWQTTAINLIDDEQRDQFYSSVLTSYIICFSIGVLAVLVVAKPIILYFFAAEYSKAWRCLPFLLEGVIFHAISGNLGSLYTIFKRTKGAFYSTVIGASINIVLNIIFVPNMGIVGAAITTLIGYVVTVIYRWYDVKKFVKLKFEHKRLCPVYVTLPIQFILYYWDSTISYALRIIIVLCMIICNYKLLLGLISRR